MIRIGKHIIFLIALLANWTSIVFSEEITPIEPSISEAALLEMINDARKEPLATAASLGFDPSKILEDFPEMKDVLIAGMPALQFNSLLYEAACEHNQDMIDRDYYSSVNPDGKNVDQRFADKGYVSEYSGETLGMLAFANFLPASGATRVFFESMFKDELNPENDYQKNILNENMGDAAVSIKASSKILNGTKFNTYTAVCDFGNKASVDEKVGKIERLLMILVNEFRTNPDATAESLGIELESLYMNCPDLMEILQRYAQPAIPIASIEAASIMHSLDMMTNGFVGHISSDGIGVEARMIEAGYTPYRWGESVLKFEFSPTEALDIVARSILKEMILEEFEEFSSSGELTLLNPDFKDIGVGIEFQENEPDISLFVTVSYGVEKDDGPLYVAGLVYSDEDRDGIASFSESMSAATIRIESLLENEGELEVASETEITTDSLGFFASPLLTSGVYGITVQLYGLESISLPKHYVVADDKNIWIEHDAFQEQNEQAE